MLKSPFQRSHLLICFGKLVFAECFAYFRCFPSHEYFRIQSADGQPMTELARLADLAEFASLRIELVHEKYLVGHISETAPLVLIPKKSYPVRWLIVVMSTASIALLTIIGLVLKERLSQLKK